MAVKIVASDGQACLYSQPNYISATILRNTTPPSPVLRRRPPSQGASPGRLTRPAVTAKPARRG